MTLESLANELLLDLFEYLNVIELFNGFYGLNSRFNDILLNLFQSYRIDCRSITKNDFDILCKKYFPQISKQTISLYLSNDDNTPQQIELILKENQFLHQFTRLKSFNLYHIFSEELMEKILYELKYLPALTDLNIIQCCLPTVQINNFNFLDNIWNLSKLIYYHIDVYLQSEEYSLAPTIISSSIQHVSIKGILFDLNEINLLIKRTPCLTYLKMHNHYTIDNIDIEPYISSLVTLNFSFITMNEQIIINFLKNMINLYCLTIDIYGICLDGYQLEQIIYNYLPNLKIFRFREQIPVLDQNQGDQKVDSLIKTFQSQFWIDKHKWFVRCDWNLADTYSFISLYTLPYSFNEFTIDCILLSKSTYPQEKVHQSYQQVRTLYCNTSLNDDSSPAHIYFSNLRHLTTELPVHNSFWSIFSRLDQLNTLDISLLDDEMINPQWQTLLDRTTNLRSLKLNSLSLSTLMLFIQNVNLSICQLDLQGDDQWFDEDQCNTLINSHLGIQCQMLAIDVKSCNSIVVLIKNMINLRALKVRCEDDEWDFNSLLDGNDDFVKWLQRCLPTTCIITRDVYSFDNIHFWIR